MSALHDLIANLKNTPAGMPSLKWCFGLHMIADEQAKKLGSGGIVTTSGL